MSNLLSWSYPPKWESYKDPAFKEAYKPLSSMTNVQQQKLKGDLKEISSELDITDLWALAMSYVHNDATMPNRSIAATLVLQEEKTAVMKKVATAEAAFRRLHDTIRHAFLLSEDGKLMDHENQPLLPQWAREMCDKVIELDLSRIPLTLGHYKTLVETFPNLQRLTLGGTMVLSEEYSLAEAMQQLILDEQNNSGDIFSIGQEGVQALAKLKSLHVLRLEQANVIGSCLDLLPLTVTRVLVSWDPPADGVMNY